MILTDRLSTSNAAKWKIISRVFAKAFVQKTSACGHVGQAYT